MCVCVCVGVCVCVCACVCECVKDLMFYLDTQRSVENSADKEQIQNGFLLVSESESDKSTRGKKQRNKRSKKDKKKKS